MFCMADTGGTVVELRVHGVSGTPPEALLGCPTEFIEQVAGDKSAGFWRRRKWIDDASNADTDDDLAAPDTLRWRRVMEAYSWGGLTSRRANRAVWLLFLPFIFINLAHWMLPPAAKERRSAGSIAVALLRLLALSFTLTLMLAAALAVMDVMVWQCMCLDHCGSRLGPLSRMMSISRGQQVAISAVPLVVVIAVLWFLGRENTWDDKGDDDEDDADTAVPPPHPAVMEDEVPLEKKTFWHADESVLRMRACHVMAWNACLAALALAAPLHYTESSTVRSMSFALLVANGLILADRRRDHRVEQGDRARRRRRRPADAPIGERAVVLAGSPRRVVGLGRGGPCEVSGIADAFSGVGLSDLCPARCTSRVAPRGVRVHRGLAAPAA